MTMDGVSIMPSMLLGIGLVGLTLALSAVRRD